MKRFGRVLLIALIGFLILTCTASAQIIEEKSGYIVRSVGYDTEKTGNMPSLESMALSLYSITEGEINYHSSYVGSGKTSIIYDVEWEDSGNDLGLRIITPDGVPLGYYHDSVDGATDGRIYLEISSYLGIATGDWNSRIKGFSVSGTEYYSLGVSVA